MPRRLLLALLAVLPAVSAAAQVGDVRELDVPVDHVNLVNATAAEITTVVNTGYRIVDLEVRSATPTFTATLVRNTGAYAIGWWWYYNLTATDVSNFISQNQARLIDLEPYDSGGGVLRFACVMVSNTGVNAKAWWWYYNTTTTNISNAVNTNNARIIDLDRYQIGSTTHYSAVMIANTGADNRSWWWYLNVTMSQISNYSLQNQSRIYDWERRSDGNYDVVMIRDLQPKTMWWWVGLGSQAQVDATLANHGARAIDIETYTVQAGPLTVYQYNVVAINNSNALTTSIGAAMRGRTDGTVGCWLDDFSTGILAPKLSSLNADTVFEPASAIKALHHTHAMRQVWLGNTALNNSLIVMTGMSGSCPTGTNPQLMTLSTVLRLMMENSDNACTLAVANAFGVNNINNTASALGMSSTQLNHVLGCLQVNGVRNQVTLRDFSRLYRSVSNGYLGSFRDTFYELMLDSIGELQLSSIIGTEGSLLGLPQATIHTFRNLTRIAHKGGNYQWPSVPLFHRAEFGWMSLPFVDGNSIVQREYGFGAFVNDATNDTDAQDAIYTEAIPALLRDRVRAALQTWVGSTATITLFGTGCGSPAVSHTVGAPPRLGTTVYYRVNNAFPNQIALLVFGNSSTVANGIPLPMSLVPLGSAAGCTAQIDLLVSDVTSTNSSGFGSLPLWVPNNAGLIGVQLLSQYYAFGTGPFLTSNSVRSVLGL